jgi:hypothetical protein
LRFGKMLFVFASVTGMVLGGPVAASQLSTSGTAGLVSLLGNEAAAQTISIDENDLLSGIGNGVANGGDLRGRGGSGGDGGRGGNGGTAVLHDVGNSSANASSSVITGDIETGDVRGHDILVDAVGATRPVVTLVAGSFGDTGVDIFAPGGNAQSGNTGGNSNSANASGGAGGDGGNSHGGNAIGGNGGTGGDPCVVLLLGCIDANLSVQ